MASAEIIALNSDSEGEDPVPFGREPSLGGGWRASNAAGASAFEAIDLGSDNSDDEPFADSPVAKPDSDGYLASGKGPAAGPSIIDVRGSNGLGRGSGSGSASSGSIESSSSDGVQYVGAAMETEAGTSPGGDEEEGLNGSGLPNNEGKSSSPEETSGLMDANVGAQTQIAAGDQLAAGACGRVNVEGGDDFGRKVGAEQPSREGAEREGRRVEAMEGARGKAGEKDGGAMHVEGAAGVLSDPEEAALENSEGAKVDGGQANAINESMVNQKPAADVGEDDAVASEVMNGAQEAIVASAPPASQPPASQPPAASQQPAASAAAGGGEPEVLDISASAAAGGDEPEVLDISGVRVPSGTAERQGLAAEGIALVLPDGKPPPAVEGSDAGASSGEASQSASPVESATQAETVESIIGALPPGFVRCPGCPMVYELVPNENAARGGGGGLTPQELPKGASLSRRAAMRHNGRHRFRCPACSACFCGSCRVMPYHIGFDCDGWRRHEAKPKCTYCGDVAEDPEEPVVGGESPSKAGDDGEIDLAKSPCCGSQECRDRANESCKKKLACGHSCRGPGAGDCLPCIEPGCSSAVLDGDAEYCNVCWTESLLAAPCVQLGCGHFVHISCAREQLQRGRPTVRLTFAFMSCPVCRADKALAMHPILKKGEGIPEQLVLAHEVEELALQRLRTDELPPLQRSSMESLQAKMRRRMARLARNRQLNFDGNPANWRARGREVPFPPPFMPYPRLNPGHNLGRRVRAVGHPPPMLLPEPLPAGPHNEWQPFVGLGADWAMTPFVPMIPPPCPAENGARDAGPGAGGARVAGVGARVAGVGAGGAGAEVGSGGAGEGARGARRASQEEDRNRKRVVLIARADMAMAKAVAAGAAGGPTVAGHRVRGRAVGDRPAGALAISSAARERIEKRREAAKAMLKERRSALRNAHRKDVEDLVMEDDWPVSDMFPYRSRRPPGVPRIPAAVGRGAEEYPGDSNGQDSKEQLGAVRGNDWRVGDLPRGDAGLDDPLSAGWEAAVRLVPLQPGLEAGGGGRRGARRLREIVREPPEEGKEEREGRVGSGNEGVKKAMGRWGWGAGRWWGSAARHPVDDQQHHKHSAHALVAKEEDSCEDKKRRGGFAIANGEEDANDAGKKKRAKTDVERGPDGVGVEVVDGTQPTLEAPRALSRVNSGDWAQCNDQMDGEKPLLDALQWPLRPIAAQAPRPEEAPGGKDEDVVFVDHEHGNGAVAAGASPSSAMKQAKAAQSVGLEWLLLDGDVEAKVGDDDNAKDDGGEKSSADTAQDDMASSDFLDIPAGRSVPQPKRVHFAALFKKRSRLRLADGQEGGRIEQEPQLPLDSGARGGAAAIPAYRRMEQNDKANAGAVANAAMAAVKMAAHDERDSGLQAMVDNSRGGQIDLAAEGMLRLHVAPAAKRRCGKVATMEEYPAAERRRGKVAALEENRGSAAPAGAAAGAPSDMAAGSPSVGFDEEAKKAEPIVDVTAAAAPPPVPQTKEDRSEMVTRALKKYSFYQCHSCRKPYFGGLVSCEPAAPPGASGVSGVGAAGAAGGDGFGGGAEAAAAERALVDVKPQELLCGKCSAGSGGADCSEHGQEYMEHKCYWCCRKVASYFCGGVMHFCDVCHLHGFAAKPKPCLGGSTCLFGGAHPPKARNGQDEFILGCGICRPKPEEHSESAAALGP